MANPITDKEKINQANAHHAAKTLGQGWKVNPYVNIGPNKNFYFSRNRRPWFYTTNLDGPQQVNGEKQLFAFIGMMKKNLL